MRGKALYSVHLKAQDRRSVHRDFQVDIIIVSEETTDYCKRKVTGKT